MDTFNNEKIIKYIKNSEKVKRHFSNRKNGYNKNIINFIQNIQ